jgi:predicted metalloprotease
MTAGDSAAQPRASVPVNPTIIEARGVVKSFGQTPALRGRPRRLVRRPRRQ